MPRKYKSVAEHPAELKVLIKSVNDLPENLETELESLRLKFRAETQNFKLSKIDELFRISSEYCEKLRRLIPPELAERTIDKIVDSASATNFLQAHWELRTLATKKKTLKHIIEAFQYAKKNGLDTEFGFDGSLNAFSFNEDTTIKMTGFQVPELLTRNKIQIARLRECPACAKIFWAKTTISETCGQKKCADDLGNKKRLDEAKAQKEKNENHFKSRVKK